LEREPKLVTYSTSTTAAAAAGDDDDADADLGNCDECCAQEFGRVFADCDIDSIWRR
jgi:hypothetical protein